LTWDSRKDPGSRVLGIWLLKPEVSSNQEIDEEPIERVAGGRKYKIVTREYMAQGYDGFSALTKGQLLIGHDCGIIMSSIVRKYLLGSQSVNKVIRLKDQRDTSMVHQEGAKIAGTHYWERALSMVHQAVYQGHNAISTGEHMTVVDAFDDHNTQVSPQANADLLVVSLAIDGRLKDESKESSGE